MIEVKPHQQWFVRGMPGRRSAYILSIEDGKALIRWDKLGESRHPVADISPENGWSLIQERQEWTLEKVYSRCKPVGECMLWAQSVSTQSGLPQARIDGATQLVQRWVYEQTSILPKNWTVYANCGERTCCARKHLRKRSRNELGVEAAKKRRVPLEVRQRMARDAGFVKLTDEQVLAIRNRPVEMSVKEAAAKWGISVSHVRNIDSGKAHAQLTRQRVASVFDLGGSLLAARRAEAAAERLKEQRLANIQAINERRRAA